MNRAGDNITTIALALVSVASVATLVRNGGKTAQVVDSMGRAFSRSLRAAQGI